MSKGFVKIISSLLAIVMLFGMIPAFAAEEEQTEKKEAFFFDVEVEKLEYNKELVSLREDGIFSGKKALAPLFQDKEVPANDAKPGFSFSFKPDEDGKYYIWLRHTSSAVTKTNGQSMWMAINGGKYVNTALYGDQGEVVWAIVKAVDLKGGEDATVSVIPRQTTNIAYDRFVVTNDAGYEPNERTLKVRADMEARIVPAPTPTPKPTAIPLTESGEFKIIDTSSEETIISRGLTAATGQDGENKLVAQWDIAANRTLKFSGLNNISNYTNFKIRIKTNKGKKLDQLMLQLTSNDPATDGDDYYAAYLTDIGDQWKEIDVKFNKMGTSRSPLGFDQITGFAFKSSGWGMEVEEGTIVYIDDFSMYFDKEISKQLENEAYNEQYSNLNYKNAASFGDFTKIKDAVCLYINHPYGLSKTVRTPIDSSNEAVVPFIENSRTLVPVRFISEQLGAEVSYDATTQKVTIKKDSNVIEMTIGSNVIYKNGAETVIDVPAKIYNDRTFVPLRACAEALDKQVFWDSLGLIIISDIPDIYNSTYDRFCIASIIGEMVFERPDGEKMYNDMVSVSGNSHPRLLRNKSQIEAVKEAAKTDAGLANWINILTNRTRGILNQPVVEYVPPKETYVSSRLLSTARAAMNKLVPLGVCYQLTGDSAFAERAWKEIETVCSFAEWDPDHFLDTAEFGYGVAFAYDWCYDYFTEEQRNFIEDSLYKLIVTPAVNTYNGSVKYQVGWISATTNWNAVCNAGSLLSAMMIAENPKYTQDCKYLFGKIINSLEAGVRDYAPDGGYAEGSGYWSYGTNYLVHALASMNSAMGTNYGIAKFPGVMQTGYYAIFIDGPVGTFNYADGSQESKNISNAFWFASESNDADFAGLRYKELNENTSNVTAYDIIYYTTNKNDFVNLAPDMMFTGIGTATFRTNWTDADAVFAGIHGGKNNSNHGNLDAGTFILDAVGERWFIDLGGDSYSLPNYFGAEGLTNYYRKRAEGQNTVIVNPYDKADQYIYAINDIIDYESKPKGGFAVVHMTDALGVAQVENAKRGLMLTSNRRSTVVQDEIILKEPGEVYWFAHTKAQIEVAPDGRSAILSQNGKRLYCEIVGETEKAKFTVMDAVKLESSPAYHALEGSTEGIRKLTIHLEDVSSVNMAVVMTPLNEGETEARYEYEFKKLDDWSIADGEMAMPTATGITVDGVALEGFNSYTTEYEVILPIGSTVYPKVEATPADGFKIEIIQPETLGESTSIRVYQDEEGENSASTTYQVRVRAQQPVEISASSSQEGNPPEQAFDGDISTRWSAEDENWIMFTFYEPKEVEAVSIAFMSASSRQSKFDLEYSLDGNTWTKFFSGMSTKSQEVFEDFKLPEKTKVKAIRLTGYGNTSNMWNSINEVQFK